MIPSFPFARLGHPAEPDDAPPLPPGSGESPCPDQAGDPPKHREEDGPQQLH